MLPISGGYVPSLSDGPPDSDLDISASHSSSRTGSSRSHHSSSSRSQHSTGRLIKPEPVIKPEPGTSNQLATVTSAGQAKLYELLGVSPNIKMEPSDLRTTYSKYARSLEALAKVNTINWAEYNLVVSLSITTSVFYQSDCLFQKPGTQKVAELFIGLSQYYKWKDAFTPLRDYPAMKEWLEDSSPSSEETTRVWGNMAHNGISDLLAWYKDPRSTIVPVRPKTSIPKKTKGGQGKKRKAQGSP